MPPKRPVATRRANDRSSADPDARPSKRTKRQPATPPDDPEEMADSIVVSNEIPASSISRRARPRKESEDPLALQASSSSSPAGQSSALSRRVTRRTVVEVVVPTTSRSTSSRSTAKPRAPISSAKPSTSKKKPATMSKAGPRDASPSPAPSLTSSTYSASRISTRVPKLSRRALESGHVPPPRVLYVVPIEPSVISPSPLRHARGGHRPVSPSPSPSPSRSRSPSNSDAGGSHFDLPESSSFRTRETLDHKLKAQQARFLQHERTTRAREARNFNWEGEVNEPRKLRGGKVVEVGNDEISGRRGGRGQKGSDIRDENDDEGDEFGIGLKVGNGSMSKDENGKGKGRADSIRQGDGDQDMDEPTRSDTDMPNDQDRNPFVDYEDELIPELPDRHMDDLTYDDFPGAHNLKKGLKRAHKDVNKMDSINITENEVLSPYTRSTLQAVLDILTSRPTTDPPPFLGEPTLASILEDSTQTEQGPPVEVDPAREKERMKKYEALGQLVGLLMGTVSRGEGNSCLVLGGKGSGKTRTVNRAISLVSNHLASSGTAKKPIVVRLDGIAQRNDMLAIREMGRQIAIGEGRAMAEEEGEDEEGTNAENSAPTTLPAHLLALLTQPSERAIVIVIDHFDLFTQHARQALLYCLLDVVQSVRPGASITTGRGVAVVGLTSRVDTTLLLEKRVKSRFSQRVFRVASPLAGADLDGCRSFVRAALSPKSGGQAIDDEWSERWKAWVDATLHEASVGKAMQRLSDVSSDPRVLYRPFIRPIIDVLSGTPLAKFDSQRVAEGFRAQLQESGWHAKADKLKGLSAPALVVLIVAKHFSYAGKEEFNFAMAEHEYHRFAQSALAGSGRARWSNGILRMGWDQLLRTGLLFPATRFRPNPNPYMHKFLLCRSLLSRNEIVAYFKGDGAKVLGTELSNWGRTAGGHA